jgi:hypothetical protein
MERRSTDHERYIVLCGLVGCGHASSRELAELTGHLEDCPECLTFLRESAAAWAKTCGDDEPESDLSLPAGMTERFIARARSEGLPVSQWPSTTDPQPTVRWRWQPSKLVLGSTTVLGLLTTGILLALFTPRSGTQVPPHNAHATTIPTAPAAAPLSATDPAGNELKREYADLANQLRKAQLTIAEQLHSHNADVKATEAARTEISKLEAELNSVRAKEEGGRTAAVVEESELASLRTKVKKLTADLEDKDRLVVTQTSELERERRLNETLNEARDLIADPNVHVWTVYSTDNNGKRQQAFGRIVYTEGTRLVLYAYRLPPHKNLDSQTSFCVWGERVGASPVKILGTLHIDDVQAGRWKLTFDDQNVLAQINGIFVTAEPGQAAATEPQGKRILSARLDSNAYRP